MKLLLTILLVIAAGNLLAQRTTTYPIAVSFNSQCCGVPSAKPLLNMIATFKKKNRIKKKIQYVEIAPLGREGEYNMAFALREFTPKQRTAFIKELTRIVPTLNDKGSAELLKDYSAEGIPERATIILKKI